MQPENKVPPPLWLGNEAKLAHESLLLDCEVPYTELSILITAVNSAVHVITSPDRMSSGSFNWKHTITFHAGVAQDADKALELYDSACKAGSMGGCNNAGLVMQNRNPPNLDEAVKYFQKACDGGLKNGCFNMSGLYLQVHCRQWQINPILAVSWTQPTTLIRVLISR